MAPSTVGVLALVFYLAAEVFSIAHLRKERRGLGLATTFLFAAAFLTHFIALQLRARALHSVPYRDLPDSMSLFAWMLAASYGFLLFVHRERSTGPFLLPFVILFLSISLLAHGGARPAKPALTGPLFAFHVTMAILGYAALTLSFVLAMLYLIQARQIHRRKTGLLFSRLPALDVLARLQKTAIAVGVSALAIATTLGLIWAHRNWGTIWDIKVLWTTLVIAIYLFALFAGRLGWVGKKAAWISIAGFSALLFSYPIVNLFLTREHVFR